MNSIFNYSICPSSEEEDKYIIHIFNLKEQYYKTMLSFAFDYHCTLRTFQDTCDFIGDKTTISKVEEELHALQYKVDFLENCLSREQS